MLCQLCSGFDLKAIMQLKLEPRLQRIRIADESWSDFDVCDSVIYFYLNEYPTSDYQPENHVIPYHKTFDDLYQASEECDLCRALLHSAMGMIRFRKDVEDDYWGEHGPSGEELLLCGLDSGQGIQLMASDDSRDSPSYALLGGVGFYVDKDSPINQTIHGRTILESPQPEDILSPIKQWLSNCLTHHQHEKTNTMKPTRLLKYEHKNGKVSLCSSIISDVKYAALSHCWGDVQPLTLNTATKYQLEEGIPIEAFPKTFKDAFWLVHELGISYIWIDSLCIFQDDKDDWLHESSRMGDVYGNAFLTIAATRAGNCSDGFLGSRKGREYINVRFYQDEMEDKVAVSPMPLDRIVAGASIIDMEEELLSKRAWALQERYLSTRTVHFASDQMYFECQSGFQPEDNHMKNNDSDPDFKIRRRMAASDKNQHRDAWAAIVRRYTDRYLTVESDKLPAIGGLAARVFNEQILNDPGEEYLAGLWRGNLLWDLVWAASEQDESRSIPKSYMAPSWSWASINQPAFFQGPEDIQSLAIVKDAKVDLENLENPFGRVTGGWVHVCCVKLHPCSVNVDDNRLYFGEGDVVFSAKVELDPPRFNQPSVSLADYEEKESDLVVVPVTLRFDARNPRYEDHDIVRGAYFLILVSSTSLEGPPNGAPRYRRVGLGTSFEEVEYEDARKQMRDRCLTAIEQGTLEDIIIV
ncbi:hypothetical protein FPOA_03837 [Fusarium poae]|uniref:Heterokaryon incompatibility domain-containing protein n=1 Tax=Fusarium poae TaxID=36050 RepID=A0A1B8ARX6_FUSPO|nr:hypothetical protein FPOA_03837 [Fusarium poae]